MLEEERLDGELPRGEGVEDALGVVRPVVVAHAGVVTADDEVREAVVLARDGVKERLARARVSRGKRKHTEHGTVLGEIAVEQDLIVAHRLRLRRWRAWPTW